jgi:AraC family transcriptional regulator of adaptative response/methylated-DNA-[protein]-cysteine methyltransferase
MRICCAVAQTSYLGWLLVAATDRGLCSLLLGDDPETLQELLRTKFPGVEIREHDPAFSQVVARVVTFVESPRIGLDLPLDIQGTAFQQRVWAALREIPPGATASYSEIAARIGRPKAVRAVAAACAANPVAIVVPCHRVIRSDGNLAGYYWGIERKQALLKRETGEENED